jgi:enoyl-CoA hydratase/carnithine racemase
MSDLLVNELVGSIAVLTLNRPEKHNAFNREMLDQLSDALAEIEIDNRVQAVIITGAGDRAFCAGMDMREGASRVASDRPSNPSPFNLLLELSKPCIAAINGYCYGGGTLLALMCDLRIADSTARFRFVGAAYGLVVGAGLLSKLVGPAQAKDLIFSTRVLSANDALSIGLVNQVAATSAKTAALEAAQTISQQSAAAIAAAKRLINGAMGVQQLMLDESRANEALRGLPDQGERFRAAAEAVTGKSARNS